MQRRFNNQIVTFTSMRRRNTCHLAVSSDSGIIVFHEFGLSHSWRDAVGPQNSPNVDGSDWIRHKLKLAVLAPRDRLGHPCPCLDDAVEVVGHLVVASFARELGRRAAVLIPSAGIRTLFQKELHD